jgi:uncharacterized protein YjbI with pentapeptide repeats
MMDRVLKEMNLTNLDLTGSVMSHIDFSSAVLKNTKFNSSNLSFSNFRNSDLTNADLRGANLKCANFRGAKLNGTKFDGADMSGTQFDDDFNPMPQMAVKDLFHMNNKQANKFGLVARQKIWVDSYLEDNGELKWKISNRKFEDARQKTLNVIFHAEECKCGSCKKKDIDDYVWVG